jgi:hypothetical protein
MLKSNIRRKNFFKLKTHYRSKTAVMGFIYYFLLNRYRLGKVTRLIYIAVAVQGSIVRN